MRELKEKLLEIKDEIVSIVHTILESDVGINPKTGTNTLQDSNLYNNIEVDFNEQDIEILNLMIPEYGVLYVDAEGHKWARRPANPDLPDSKKDQSYPPPNVIAEWAGRKGIPTDNSTIYLICRSIWWEGIQARPFIDASFEEIDKRYTKWADELFETLIKPIDEFFNDAPK